MKQFLKYKVFDHNGLFVIHFWQHKILTLHDAPFRTGNVSSVSYRGWGVRLFRVLKFSSRSSSYKKLKLYFLSLSTWTVNIYVFFSDFYFV